MPLAGLGSESPQLPLSRRPRTLKARGSHLKPGNAQTGNPLPPKQFLARRMRGAQLKQNDPHLLISSVATKRLAIYAATLNKDIWLFPGKQVHFCMAELRAEASLSPASRLLGCSRLGIRPPPGQLVPPGFRLSSARQQAGGYSRRSQPAPSLKHQRGKQRGPGLGCWGCDVLGKSAPAPEPRVSGRWARVGDTRFVRGGATSAMALGVSAPQLPSTGGQ